MLLHEAVRAARKDLGLSQKKLAEAVGIQRRQLATLENGGNVTLATIRKVIAHLPNLESFTIDAVKVEVSDEPRFSEGMFGEGLTMLAFTLEAIAARIRDGGSPPTSRDLATLREVNKLLGTSIEDSAKRMAAAPPPTPAAAEPAAAPSRRDRRPHTLRAAMRAMRRVGWVTAVDRGTSEDRGGRQEG